MQTNTSQGEAVDAKRASCLVSPALVSAKLVSLISSLFFLKPVLIARHKCAGERQLLDRWPHGRKPAAALWHWPGNIIGATSPGELVKIAADNIGL